MAAIAIITFNLIFENYLNFFGEITYFADRLFYQDWWNSTNFEEFNRKWNKPVHEFLYRHVYIELIFYYQVSVKKAQLMTFLFSALLHEYTLAVML
jgi:sterol O-acyltransferase